MWMSGFCEAVSHKNWRKGTKLMENREETSSFTCCLLCFCLSLSLWVDVRSNCQVLYPIHMLLKGLVPHSQPKITGNVPYDKTHGLCCEPLNHYPNVEIESADQLPETPWMKPYSSPVLMSCTSPTLQMTEGRQAFLEGKSHGTRY